MWGGGDGGLMGVTRMGRGGKGCGSRVCGKCDTGQNQKRQVGGGGV